MKSSIRKRQLLQVEKKFSFHTLIFTIWTIQSLFDTIYYYLNSFFFLLDKYKETIVHIYSCTKDSWYLLSRLTHRSFVINLMSTYYFKDLRIICEPLYKRLKKNAHAWIEHHTNLVKEIKQRVKHLPCINIPHIAHCRIRCV